MASTATRHAKRIKTLLAEIESLGAVNAEEQEMRASLQFELARERAESKTLGKELARAREEKLELALVLARFVNMHERSKLGQLIAKARKLMEEEGL